MTRRANDRQQTQGLLQDLQRRLDSLSGKAGQADLPVGLGLEDGDGKNFGGSQQQRRPRAQQRWHALGRAGRRESRPKERRHDRRAELPDELRPGAESPLERRRYGSRCRIGAGRQRGAPVRQTGLRHGAVQLDVDGLDCDDRR